MSSPQPDDIRVIPAAIKWVGGIAAAVIAGVLIAYLTAEKKEPPPEKPGLTPYDHLLGVLSLDYPSFFEKVTHEEIPGKVVVFFGNHPPDEDDPVSKIKAALALMLGGESSFMRVAVEPRPEILDPTSSTPSGSDPPDPDTFLESKTGWIAKVFVVEEVTTTRRGVPPKKSIYVERKRRARIMGPSLSIIFQLEVKDQFAVSALASIEEEERRKYRKEIDKSFESITFDPDVARMMFANAYYSEGLRYGKQKQLDKAIDAFKRVLALDPNHKKGHLLIAGMYYRKKSTPLLGSTSMHFREWGLPYTRASYSG